MRLVLVGSRVTGAGIKQKKKEKDREMGRGGGSLDPSRDESRAKRDERGR